MEDWHILVVEDDHDARQIIKQIFDHHNIDYTMARNGQEARARLDHITPTLILTDLAMPIMNGWELLQAVKDDPAWSDIPVIAMTAYDSKTVKRGAVDAGFTTYIPKPIKGTVIITTLQDVLSEE